MNASPKNFNLRTGSMLLGLATVWGGSFFFNEIALREVAPMTIALHRIFWALPLLFLIMLWRRESLPRSFRPWLGFFGMGALNNAIPFSLILWGQTTIDSGLAAILNGTTAFFGVVTAGVLLADEKMTLSKVAGATVGFFGVAVVMGLDSLVSLDVKNLAQLAVLGATLSYALAGVWGRTFLADNPATANAAGMLTASAVLMIPIVLVIDGPPSFYLSAPTWFALISVAVLSTAIAYFFYSSILASAGAANLMLVALLIPPFAIALGVTFLGETIEPNAYAGFVLIGLGLVITDGRVFRRFGNDPSE